MNERCRENANTLGRLQRRPPANTDQRKSNDGFLVKSRYCLKDRHGEALFCAFREAIPRFGVRYQLSGRNQ